MNMIYPEFDYLTGLLTVGAGALILAVGFFLGWLWRGLALCARPERVVARRPARRLEFWRVAV